MCRCALAFSVCTLLVMTGCGDDSGGIPTGSAGGPCYADDTCDGELICQSDICVASTCTPGATEICTCTGGASGTRTCGADETWGQCECANPGCGNGLIDPGEICDSSNLAGRTCESEGFASGDLACDPVDCSLDVSGCYDCGPDNTACDTGNLCDASAVCAGDVCVPTPVDCSGTAVPDDCHVAQCNPATGNCDVVTGNEAAPCDDGDLCTTDATCLAGTCGGGQPVDCSSLDGLCQVGTCDPSNGSCYVATEADNTPCTATDLCEVNASCQNGLCVGTPMDCTFSPLNECNIMACNPVNGQCEGTADATANGDPCSLTGDLCMDGKTCLNGLCQGGTPQDCSHLSVNCDNGVCDPATGNCTTQTAPAGGSCDAAADQCNTGECDINGDCNPVPIADNTPCNDYDSCTPSSFCQAGVCTGTVDPTCSVYFEEVFEACPTAGWTLGGDWECGTPSAADEPAGAVSGTGCLGTVMGADYNNNNAWATAGADTPWIDLSTSTAPTLSFFIWIDTEGFTYDGANVKVSTDGTTFSLVTTSLPYTLTVGGEQAWGAHLAASGWQFVTADLSAYQGQQIILRYAFSTDSSVTYPGVYIDNVAVSEPLDVPLYITTSDPLPNGLLSVPYSQVLTRAGGSPAAVWSITGGNNHTWLSIDPATGELTGTPTAGDVGPVSVDVHLEEPANPSNNTTVTFTFDVIDPADVSLSIATTLLPAAMQDSLYSQIIARTGGSPAAVWSITGGSNHTWLTIDPVTGVLSGTPTVANAGPVSVDVYIEEPSNPTNNAIATFNFSVVSALYSEDFESACPGTWTLGGDWECGTPTSGPGAAFTGNQCLGTVLAGNYSNNQAWATATATSGAYDLSTTTAPQLTFWMWLDTEGVTYDGVNLKISTDGATFTVHAAVTPAYTLTVDSQQAWGGNQSAAGWQLYTADLSAFAGQATVYLQLGLHTDSSITDLGAYVDDLMIVD